MHPVLFTLPGGFTIYGYGFMLAVGILLAAFGATYTASRDGIEAERLYDIGILSFVGGVVGGRLEYVRTHWADKFVDAPWTAFDLRDGGYVFYGGLVLAVILGTIYTRWRGLSFAHVSDHAAPMIGIGIGCARIGCFLVGCCYGCPSDLPWAATFPEEAIAPEGIARHPTQLYESAFAFSLAAGLTWLRGLGRLASGVLLAVFGVAYGGWRIFVETLRCDGERGYAIEGVLTNGQFTSLILIAVAVAWGVSRSRASQPR